MKKFEDNYNPKIDFRFLAFANMKIDQFESTYDLRKVFNGEMKASTNNQIDLIKTKEVFEMFKVEGLNEYSIKKFLKLFNVIVSNSKIQMLLKYDYSLEKKDYYDYASRLFMYIIKKSLFGFITFKFAILIFNTIMFKNKTLPIVFYPHTMKTIVKLINSGLSLEGLKNILDKQFDISVMYNTPHKLVSKEEVLNVLKQNRKEMFDEYGVEHIVLTGSYVNGLYTEYSDVDLIVTTKEKMKKSDIKTYLENKLLMPVDVVLSDAEFTKTKDLQHYRLEVF